MDDQKFIHFVGLQIAALRKKHNLTLEQLGDACEPTMDRQAVHRIESGFNISLSTLNRLSKALDVEPHELLNFKSIKKSEKGK